MTTKQDFSSIYLCAPRQGTSRIDEGSVGEQDFTSEFENVVTYNKEGNVEKNHKFPGLNCLYSSMISKKMLKRRRDLGESELSNTEGVLVKSRAERGVARNPLSTAQSLKQLLHAKSDMVGQGPRHHGLNSCDAREMARKPLSSVA
ncbi:uncharacterized protein PHALS_10910 [Plasmopara halstedii]|uniref:Uncharacterized protein n=1 Tax=Plasmopara halstedii TaxID=4781 RepID=A0A0P1AJI8_PLAHL|nr:uncharacterized protein PHALS_10910 [Plasmopara halstedii]CEG40726.1 hypothetical protein PHALS_10910 [Plasmopara halstedii]|eukprot:XP_024577095.1 hypothetical protein PHALS_10910 [Plasmopara halstedii]